MVDSTSLQKAAKWEGSSVAWYFGTDREFQSGRAKARKICGPVDDIVEAAE